MIYKPFELWGHWKCPHKLPSRCNTYVIYPCHYTNVCPHKSQKHAHSDSLWHTHTHTHCCHLSVSVATTVLNSTIILRQCIFICRVCWIKNKFYKCHIFILENMNQIFFLKWLKQCMKWIELYRKNKSRIDWMVKSAQQIRAMDGRVSHDIQIMKTNTEFFK